MNSNELLAYYYNVEAIDQEKYNNSKIKYF